jgi:hypothetical protein
MCLVTFPYELTYEEYVESLYAAARETGAASRVPTIVGLGFFATGFVILLSSDRNRGDAVAPMLVMLLASFTALYPMHVAHASIQNAWRSYQQWRPSYFVTITDAHIAWHSTLTRFEIAWEGFDRTTETRRLFLLGRPGGDLLALPKRAFPSTDQEKEFRSLLARRFPTKSKGFPVIPPGR